VSNVTVNARKREEKHAQQSAICATQMSDASLRVCFDHANRKTLTTMRHNEW